MSLGDVGMPYNLYQWTFIVTNTNTMTVIIIGKMIIQALPEIPTKGLTLDDLDVLMERTRNVMSETLQSLATEVMAQVPPSYPVNKQ
jgi:hypothetical protein